VDAIRSLLVTAAMVYGSSLAAQDVRPASQRDVLAGVAVRAAFTQCGEQKWVGFAVVPFKDDPKAPVIHLDCIRYTQWWGRQRTATPFTVWQEGKLVRFMPSDEWQFYLLWLPEVDAELTRSL
jgi:hypothetical protein